MNPRKLKTEKSPRETIYEHFEEVLPIKGGWGYSKDDAVIIDSNDASVDKSKIFNGIRYENIFIEKRLLEEMIITPPLEEKYFDVRWNKISQKLIQEDGKNYDYIIINVNAILQTDWLKIMENWEKSNNNPYELEKRILEKKCNFRSEFWFEISSFFGKYNGIILQDQETGQDYVTEFEFNDEEIKQKTSHKEIANLEPIETKFGYEIYLNEEGLYYIYCAEQDTLNSVIGIEQAYTFIEQQSKPCNGVPIKTIDFYKIYNCENKYQIYNPEDKFENETSTLEEASLLIQNLSQKRKKDYEERERAKQREIEAQKADPSVIFIYGLLWLIIAIYGGLRYFYSIPNGTYLAQAIRINDYIIGQGTPASKKYPFILHDNNALVNKIPFLYNEEESNLIKKKFTNMLNSNEELVITFLGNVKIYNKEKNYTEEIKVFY